MFGPAILVNPVSEESATSRSLYFAGSQRLVRFWLGEKLAGGWRVTADASLDRIRCMCGLGRFCSWGMD